MISEKIRFSNARARNQLKLRFRSLDDTVRDGLVSIVDGGWVTPKAAAEGVREGGA